MYSRWLARELARRDRSLAGFWPLHGNLLDHSGLAHHGVAFSAWDGTGPAPGGLGMGLSGSSIDLTQGALTTPRFVADAGRNGYGLHCGTNVSWIGCGKFGDADFVAGKPMTLSCWVRQTGSTGGTEIIGNNWTGGLISRLDLSGSVPKGYQLSHCRDTSGDGFRRFKFLIGDGSSGYLEVGAVYFGIDSNWHHVLVSYDGKGKAAGVRIYIDGQPRTLTVESDTFSSSASPSVSATPLSLGRTLGYGSSSVTLQDLVPSDTLALCRIYRRCLSGSEAQNLYRREWLAETRFYQPLRNIPKLTLTGFLFLHGKDLKNNSTTLFVEGTPDVATQAMTLFISGPLQQTKQATLYIWGDTFTAMQHGCTLVCFNNIALNQAPLFVQGKGVQTQQSTLYIHGVYHSSEGMPLILRCQEPPKLTHTTTLSIRGCTPGSAGFVHAAPLFVFNNDDPHQHRSMNLFLLGPSTGTTPRNMNLVVAGGSVSADRGCNLFLQNNQVGLQRVTSLFVWADGQTDGGLPYGHGMPLYLERVPVYGQSRGCSLFVNTPGTPKNNNLSLYVVSTATSTKQTTLAIPNTKAGLTMTGTLFIAGF